MDVVVAFITKSGVKFFTSWATKLRPDRCRLTTSVHFPTDLDALRPLSDLLKNRLNIHPNATLVEDGTTQRTRRSCAHLQKIDTAKDAAGGSLQTLTTGSDFLLGNTWEQDQEQDACLPAYRPLENKTERQTVSSVRREQGPRALLTKRSPSREQGREINGLIDRLGTRTPSAAHQTIESAAESEIGPSNSLVQSIGLWDATHVAELTVFWPTSQTTQTFRDLAADQAIEITEGTATYRVVWLTPTASP